MQETSGKNKLNMASHQELYPYCEKLGTVVAEGNLYEDQYANKSLRTPGEKTTALLYYTELGYLLLPPYFPNSEDLCKSFPFSNLI
jgi:hypothetical protein